MPRAELLCETCGGEGGEEYWVSGQVDVPDEFGNKTDWEPCHKCDGSGMHEKLFNRLQEKDLNAMYNEELERRLEDCGVAIKDWKKRMDEALAYEGTDDKDRDILAELEDDMQELLAKHWPEPE